MATRNALHRRCVGGFHNGDWCEHLIASPSFVRRERVAIVAAFAELTEQAQADGECMVARYGDGWTVRLEHHDIRDNRGRATRGQAGAN